MSAAKRRAQRERLRDLLQIRVWDIPLTLAILAVACQICALLRASGSSDSAASMIFILAVFMCARFTSGYLCGIIASVLSVLAVNYIFTYPYFHFNFTLAGYPLTMLCMLAVSLATSALTTNTKKSERIKLLAEKEKMRGNLLRAVSHDLRTPLTSILGATSAVIENDEALTSEERISLLRDVQDDAQWLIRMVENLLAVTRIDAEKQAKVVKTPQAAEEIVSEVIGKFKKRFDDVAVVVSVPNELLMIPMDPVLIEQVLVNLLENAALHGTGATKIELSVKRTGDTACFEVRDNGCGIDPEKLPHLFDGNLSGSDGIEGDSKKNMGIGLSVCNTIVLAHGGHMRAFNDETDGGAVFQFELAAQQEGSNGK